MADTNHHETQIYQLRAVLRGISPLIVRRLLVRSDSTLAQLHQVLQVAFGWDDEHLNRFEIRPTSWAASMRNFTKWPRRKVLHATAMAWV